MTRRKRMGWVAAAAVVLMAACKEPLDVGNFSAAGQWKGNLARAVGTDSARYTFTFDLDQNERDISGTATIQSGTQTVEADVDGVWDYPEVTLRLTAPGYAPLDYAAQYPNARRDTLRGPITGSGFTSTTLTIVRQP
ncbi:MAG TPA: hypothetical protein VFJ16_09865 [Longimicrobium sp.]|nr:hypothetical protein [Longimicrobium sp.]